MPKRNNPGCDCCPQNCPLTVKVIGCGDDSYPLDGVTVTVKDSTGTTTVGTGVTGPDGVAVIPLPNSGTYRVSTDACTPGSTSVNVTCPGGASITLSSCVTVTQSVQGCNPIFPAVVAIVENTAGWSGQNQAPGKGAYTFRITGDPCWEDYGPDPFTITGCGPVALPTVQLVPRKIAVTLNVVGCVGAPLQGATVTLFDNSTSGAVFSQTQLTDANGDATFTEVPTYPIDGAGNCNGYKATVSKARFQDTTAGVVVGCADGVHVAFGGNASARMTAAAGYVCTSCCNEPIPVTLFATDSWGTVTLTYNSANAAWVGCHAGPAETLNCGTQLGDCQADLAGNLVTVEDTPSTGYRLKCPGGVFQLFQDFSACVYVDPESVRHVQPMPGGCSADGFAVGANCSGGGTALAGGSVSATQPCAGIPLALSFDLDGHPAGTVPVSE